MTEKMTERLMLDVLARRYTAPSQGGDRWVRAEHVRNGTGFMGWSDEHQRCVGPLRTADFIAVDGWESKGLQIHGHEVKISRADWLHELKDPTKAEAFKRYCHRWWLVVPDAKIVRREELPPGWGVLVLRGGKLFAAVQAPPLTPEALPHPLVVALMRSAAKTARRAALNDLT